MDGNVVRVLKEIPLLDLPTHTWGFLLDLFGETSAKLRAPFILLDEKSGWDLWDLRFFCL